ncbi:MAG: hypothetical protein GXO85_10590 [Chlorobi bacterium]|nr:hypothetical protein [Chlorobiota bacterium]
MEHEFTKPLAARIPPSSAQGCVHSEFCKFMFHKPSMLNKNYICRAISAIALIYMGQQCFLLRFNNLISYSSI